MASESCLRLTLGVFGLLCSALTFCALILGTDISFKESRWSAVERLPRKERAADSADECLWVLIVGESVKTLKSPNYPEPYPSNAYCRWLLTTLQPNDTITLKIDTLSIEPEQQCRLDSLRVFLGSSDQAPSLGPFCGNVNDLVLETNSSTLLLVFRSDSMYEDSGFSVDYFTPTDKGCQELLTDASDTLTSPGFPDNYPDDTDCSTTITLSGEDKRILLHFDSMDLEYGENCTFDYIQIFDGSDKNSVSLGKMCRQTDAGLSFESSSNSLLVHFHSDGTVNKRGYRARYSSVDRRSKLVGNCRWENDERNGTVSSPNYPENYPSFSNCSLWIVAPEDSHILVTFDAVLLEMESNCSYDFLQISERGQLRGRYCGRGTEPKSFLSHGNEIQIQFQSDSFVEFLGFKLRYEFIKTDNTEKEADIGEEEVEPSDESFTFSAKPENVTLAAGSEHMLHCQTEYPNARIRWLKGEAFLARDDPLPGLRLLENGTLWIREMRRELAGRYTCVAVAPEEGDIAATLHVQMKDDCGIVFRKTPFDSEFKEGEFAHMECLADVGVSWEKDGRPLRPHVTVLKNGYIFVERVTLEDAGLYSCVARDAASGCVQKVSAFLNVSEKTKIQEMCGRAKLEVARKRGKIVGGYDAPKGAYPWQIMLWDERERKSFCGATLLNERWMVTAAHCIFNKYNSTWHRIVVKLGKHDTERVEEQEVSNSIADFSAILYHPEFHPRTFDNDLALVRLRHRVHFTDYILPVCLPHRDLSETLLNAGSSEGPRMGTVIGWGKLKEGGPLPRFLQEIKVPVVDDEVCRRSTNFSVTRNMFCAGYSQEVIGDSCHGDSGGPLMMQHQGRWYILGIVSWGEGCGKTNKYGFYTRLSNHLSWIQGIIKS